MSLVLWEHSKVPLLLPLLNHKQAMRTEKASKSELSRTGLRILQSHMSAHTKAHIKDPHFLKQK